MLCSLIGDLKIAEVVDLPNMLVTMHIPKSVFEKGIKASMFFTKPFQAAFKRLPDELVQAYSIGLEKQIQVNINKK